ncbi:MAG: hypothetical protein QOJ57_1239 [Thermoleophilaceae bacterium]|nr:hypothetical protein [Thermoleophilaceae bacterium]
MVKAMSRHPWLRSARAVGIALLLLIVLLSVGGYFLTSSTIRRDRDAAAARRADVETLQTQEVLGRARAYVQGLGDVLAAEQRPGQGRFASLARATSASVGLNDVLWVEEVPRSERGRYERRTGAPITRLTRDGRFERAPAAASYLPATFTSRTRPELRSGVDVSTFPGLAPAIRNRATIFAVGASRPGALGTEPGFYLLEAASFGHGRASGGFLVAFVPQGWFTTTLGGDPRRVAIRQGGRRIEGELREVRAAASFDALGRRWRIDVAHEPPSGLQSTVPWLALTWPIAAALIALGVGRAILLRRRAEREVERIFDLSLDLLASAGFDGYLKRVNPAVERTLGYTRQELLSRPLAEFVHPDDRERGRDVLAGLRRGDEIVELENRFVRADGSTVWLEVSCRAVPTEGIVYASARDITDRKRSEEELRRAHEMVEASRDELAGSRARVVAAAAEERKRVVRDLHDGAQQKIVNTVITLQMALRNLENGNEQTGVLVGEALNHAEEANAELRALARGILPPALAKGGLGAGIEELASRISVPVETDVSTERLPAAIEATAYFVVSEALTNVMKHSGAHHAQVRAKVDGGAFRVEVRDDGAGGAEPGPASGLTGLRDRVEALGGTIEIVSPGGRGTSILVEIPIGR